MPSTSRPRSASAPNSEPPASLFRLGIGPRLAMAAGLSGLVWLAIGWALAA